MRDASFKTRLRNEIKKISSEVKFVEFEEKKNITLRVFYNDNLFFLENNDVFFNIIKENIIKQVFKKSYKLFSTEKSIDALKSFYCSPVKKIFMNGQIAKWCIPVQNIKGGVPTEFDEELIPEYFTVSITGIYVSSKSFTPVIELENIHYNQVKFNFIEDLEDYNLI